MWRNPRFGGVAGVSFHDPLAYCCAPSGVSSVASRPGRQLHGAQRFARNGGVLVGSLVDGQVQIWLARGDGELLATMWPGEYRAGLNPLVVLDEQGRVVARGGEHLHVSGGFLPSGASRTAGYDGVFFVSRVLREP